MKKTTTILAALALGMANATAGVEYSSASTSAPAPSGKGVGPSPTLNLCAGPISYNNVEILYANTDMGGDGDNADGAILRIEHSLFENFYLTGSGQYSDFDYGNTWNLSAGFGGFMPLTENIHLAADAGVLYTDWEYDYYVTTPKGPTTRYNESDNDTGWYVRPHLRAKWGCLTVHAGAQYSDISESEEWSYFINAYYQIAQAWDITAGWSDGDESETFTAGVRWRY